MTTPRKVKPLTLNEVLKLTRKVKRWYSTGRALGNAIYGIIKSNERRFGIVLTNQVGGYELSVYPSEIPVDPLFTETGYKREGILGSLYEDIQTRLRYGKREKTKKQLAKRDETISKLRKILAERKRRHHTDHKLFHKGGYTPHISSYFNPSNSDLSRRDYAWEMGR